MSEAFDEFFDDEHDLMEAGRASQADAGSDDPVADAPERGASTGEADDAAASKRDAAETEADAETPAPQEGRAAAPAHQAPPFWMVLAIAGVSLLLGGVVGYLVGTSTAIAGLSAEAAQQSRPADGAGSPAASMPEGHPELDVDDEGNATVADGGQAVEGDALSRANTFFDMGMAAMQSAQDEAARQQAAGLFAQAVELYDEYLASESSAPAEVDRAICVFYSGDHEGAIASLESFVKRDDAFAPAWANLGMFYESHGDADKAREAYEKALDASSKDDTYGVADYARQRLEALDK